MCEDFELQWTH